MTALSLYVAGPMRGIEAYNFPAFDAAAAALEALGHDVFSPAARDRRVGFDPVGMDGTEDLAALGFSLNAALAADMAFITMEADGIVVLPGWEQSKGARAEVATAHALGLPVWRLAEFLDRGQDALPVGRPPHVTPLGLEDSGPGTEVRVTSATGGSKGRKPLELGAVDPLAREELGRVAAFGSAKYDRGNYLKGYPWSLCVDALYRHLMAFERGEDRDPESGLLHTVHAAWHGLALASFVLRDVGVDDRSVA